MNTLRPQYPEDPLTARLRSEPDLARAVRNINTADLRKIGELFQTERHRAMLALGMEDREGIAEALAACKGADSLIVWIESLRQELEEYEETEEERGGGVNGYDG